MHAVNWRQLPRWAVIIVALGFLAGVLSWPATPLQRVVAAVLGLLLPIPLCLAIAWAGRSYNRTWLQFSLRGLLIWVVISSFTLLAWVRIFGPARDQEELIAAVENLGGTTSASVYGPAWFKIREVYEITFVDIPITDDELGGLVSLPGIRTVRLVRLHRSHITDVGLVHLQRFPRLWEIVLDGNKVTDDGLKTLGLLSDLGSIALNDCEITDAGLRHLASMQRLKHLSVYNTHVTEAGVAALKADIPGCAINDAFELPLHEGPDHDKKSQTTAGPVTAPDEGFAVPANAALAGVTDEAQKRWQAAGISGRALSRLDAAQVRVVNLHGALLAASFGNTILIDHDAAGFGWFVDATPGDDREFYNVTDTEMMARRRGDAYGRMDLLTAVMHEIGHLLGIRPQRRSARPDGRDACHRHAPFAFGARLVRRRFHLVRRETAEGNRSGVQPIVRRVAVGAVL